MQLYDQACSSNKALGTLGACEKVRFVLGSENTDCDPDGIVWVKVFTSLGAGWIRTVERVTLVPNIVIWPCIDCMRMFALFTGSVLIPRV